MTKLITRIPGLLLAISLLSSCSTILLVDKTFPPEIQLGRNGQRIVIQNFFDYNKPEYVREKHSAIYRDGIEAFSNSLVMYLGESDLVSALMGDSIVPVADGRLLSEVLDPGYVEATCRRYNADMLLSIDSMNIYFDFESEGTPMLFGGEGVTKHFYLVYIPYLSLYDWDGTLIDRRMKDLVYHYKNRESITAFITIKPSLVNARDEVLILGEQAGAEYGSGFFSTSGSFPYTFYYGEPFKQAFRMMQRGEWGDAIRELLPLAESGNAKIAKRAAHNLYVAYIAIGDEVSAEEWYRRSQ